MSVVAFVLFAIIGLGTIGAIGSFLAHSAQQAPSHQPKSAVMETDAQ